MTSYTVIESYSIAAKSRRNWGTQAIPLLIFFATAVLFAVVACVVGLPGPDLNAHDTYDVITRLSRTLTYTLSRTPGQPVLDYCNYVFRSLGGDGAVQAWFVVASAAGITSFYCLLRDLRGVSPVLAVATLALNPLFLTHVGGVADFAVSTSFLLISLFFANRRRAVAAGLALALAVGCRLVFCVYVIPIAVLVAAAYRSKGATPRGWIKAAATAGGVAVLVSTIEYAPSFSFWGSGLLRNYPFSGIRYHASAFLFKLFIAIGAPIWLLLCGLCLSLIQKWRRGFILCINPGAAIVATLIILSCQAYFFRVPTKPELTLPILVGIIVCVHVCAGRKWAMALLLGSVSVGFVMLSPFDRWRDQYRWHLEAGWYRQNYEEAYENHYQLPMLRSLLSTLPPDAILIARPRWTIEQSEHSDIEKVTQVAGIAVDGASAFQGLGTGRVIINPGESNLRDLLDRVNTKSVADRARVFYEKDCFGLLRRGSHLDLSLYGSPIVLKQ